MYLMFNIYNFIVLKTPNSSKFANGSYDENDYLILHFVNTKKAFSCTLIMLKPIGESVEIDMNRDTS